MGFGRSESIETPLNLIILEVQIALKMKENDARGLAKGAKVFRGRAYGAIRGIFGLFEWYKTIDFGALFSPRSGENLFKRGFSTRLHPQGKGGPKGYCVETSQISLADATFSDVRSHDELRPESDGNGQEMVKWDIRIVFHKVRFCKMSQTDPVLDANRAPGMHLLQNPGPKLSGTGRQTTDEQRN